MIETWKRLRLPVANLAETPDVHVTGRVPETRPYLAFADVAVTPPRIARKACRRAASSGQEP